MIDSSLHPIIRSLRLIVFDFDGVFTTNQVLVSQDGTESVLCNRSDGLGFRLLRACNLETLIMSMEKNPVVQARAKKLEIECMQNIENKLEALRELAKDRGISLEQIAYVGNDVNDFECMSVVGLAVAPADAYPEAKAAAKWVLQNGGGYGAIREFCEGLARTRWEVPKDQSVWTRFYPGLSQLRF